MGQHLGSTKQGKHHRTLQKPKDHLSDLQEKPLRQKISANTKHRVNTYAKKIARVLSSIRLTKGCNPMDRVVKFS
jgi:HD superfamily phosphodiesterase